MSAFDSPDFPDRGVRGLRSPYSYSCQRSRHTVGPDERGWEPVRQYISIQSCSVDGHVVLVLSVFQSEADIISMPHCDAALQLPNGFQARISRPPSRPPPFSRKIAVGIVIC